jgi:hypothetical protein
LNATNKQASEILNRCNKAIKDIYGDKVPEVKKNSPVKLAEPSSYAPMKTEVKEIPVVRDQHKETTDSSDKIKDAAAEKPLSFKELSDEIVKYKDLGNVQFKQK